MSLLSPINFLRYGVANLAAPVLASAAGWIAYSRLAIDHAVDLPPALAAEQRRFASVAGQLGYYVDHTASGRPLVLIHSVNAAASAYEMRPLFEHFRGSRPVYAIDLPGFGTSDRSARDYSPALYRDAIVDFLTAVVGAPADVIALSLSSEFAALAANLRPEAFRSLTLISPTGLSADGPTGDTPRARRLHGAFDLSLWRQPLFDLVVTRPSLNYFLGRSFAGEVDSGLRHYAFLTSHQPGAAHAPLCFIAGRLFTPAVAESTYGRLPLPTLAIYDEDAHVSFERLPEVMARNPAWRAIRIVPTRGLPHWEKLAETAAALEAFWAGLGAGAGVVGDMPEETESPTAGGPAEDAPAGDPATPAVDLASPIIAGDPEQADPALADDDSTPAADDDDA